MAVVRATFLPRPRKQITRSAELFFSEKNNSALRGYGRVAWRRASTAKQKSRRLVLNKSESSFE